MALDDLGELSRFDALRFMAPGAVALAFLLATATTAGLLPRMPELSAENLAVGVFAAFVLGYALHLYGIRFTAALIKNDRERIKEDQEREKREAAKREAAKSEAGKDEAAKEKAAKKAKRMRMTGHHVETALKTESEFFEPNLRAAVLAKFNRLSGMSLQQEDLDKTHKVRWMVYLFCSAHIAKAGVADEARTARTEFEMIRAMHMALRLGFLLSLAGLGLLFLQSFSGGVWDWDAIGQHRVGATAVFLGLLLAPALHRFLLEQQVKGSLRLADATYTSFLAA